MKFKLDKWEKVYLTVSVDDYYYDDLTSMPMISIDSHRGDVNISGVENFAEISPDKKSHCYKALGTTPGKLNLPLVLHHILD